MSIKKEVNLRVTSQARSAELNAIAGSEIRAVVGIDLGDKRSSYCLLDTHYYLHSTTHLDSRFETPASNPINGFSGSKMQAMPHIDCGSN
jgi:hypothetical protein